MGHIKSNQSIRFFTCTFGKQLAVIFFIVCLLHKAQAQISKVDSLKFLLQTEKSDSNRVMLLWELAVEYDANKPDSAYYLAQRAFTLAKSINFIDGESRALVVLANYFVNIGNYPLAMEYYLQKLKIEEKRGIPEKLASVYVSMSIVYSQQEQFAEALMYGKKAYAIIMRHKLDKLELYNLLSLGNTYYKMKRLDSAIFYTTKVLNNAMQKGDAPFLGSAYNNLGNIYFAKEDTLASKSNYYNALPFLKVANDDDFLCETTLGLARVFESAGRYDSAEHYARYSVNLARSDDFKNRELDTYVFFTNFFKNKGKMDSAFFYQSKMIELKEAIGGKEKVRESQVLTMDEKRRQEDIAEAIKKDQEELRQRLQLILIGIAIPIIFFITIFLSRRKVHVKMIRFLGIMSLLFLFEYVTLLLHPLVKEMTHHTPILELLVFVGIAAILIPAHHKIQHWVIEKLTHRQLPDLVEEELNTTEQSNTIADDADVIQNKPENDKEGVDDGK